ncbi:helix-turn-helix transcriptional regulator [Flavobacterium xueshanense]|uniref:DNA binding domain-containing protein, excisionase family n=1 Tax=Flavobacterium xueshanense TaxID=935223 RepID=A0A1I2HBD1_9FLAO|nr:helix-turn-helix domain-containing protein [Flavobacterium xueshanense]SFF27484.1 DNA binding domain-containing protein, excisionase family [Flavobacterium xueshanense]
MKKEIIQFDIISVEDFKDEIIKEIIIALKDIILPIQEINEDKLLTRKEIAKMLSVSLVTLCDWEKKNIIQSYRIGNLVRYKKSVIIKAIN